MRPSGLDCPLPGRGSRALLAGAASGRCQWALPGVHAALEFVGVVGFLTARGPSRAKHGNEVGRVGASNASTHVLLLGWTSHRTIQSGCVTL